MHELLRLDAPGVTVALEWEVGRTPVWRHLGAPLGRGSHANRGNEVFAEWRRSIADLAGDEAIRKPHVAEAVQLRRALVKG